MVNHSQKPDSTLLEELLQNDETAQTEFVERFLPIVKGYVSKSFPSLRLEAEDVALDAIFAALRNMDKFDPSKGSVLSWINHQARWHAISRIRSQAKSVATVRPTVPAPLIGRVQSVEDARQLMARLTPDEQRLLTLYFVDHLTYREIANLWRTSHTTVATKLAAIITKLSI